MTVYDRLHIGYSFQPYFLYLPFSLLPVNPPIKLAQNLFYQLLAIYIEPRYIAYRYIEPRYKGGFKDI